MNKTIKTILTVIFGVLILAVIWALPAAFTINALLQEPPEFTYGEFPMELTYEINGESITVNDIYVVEYSGYDGMLGYQWKGYIQSTGEKGILIYQENDIKIVCEIGDADYYVGKTGLYEDNIVIPNVFVIEESRKFLNFKSETVTYIPQDKLYEQYGIKLINWSTAEPLKDYYENIKY